MTDPNKRGDDSSSEAVIAFVLRARNYAEDSENKIHGPEAARHGFRGGLVPGIGTYAYIIQAILRHYGTDWLERGWADVSFLKPVYDGDDLRVCLLRSIGEPKADSAPLEIAVNSVNSGARLATGRVGMFLQPEPIRIENYPDAPTPSRDARAPATIDHWPAGKILGSRALTLDLELAARTFVADVLDPSPIYVGPTAVAHPALLLAQANFLFRDNMALGPWIHTGSKVRCFGAARHGETISLRGRISEAFERKGHQYLTADLGMFANGGRPIAHFLHTAIIRLRG